MKRTIWAMTLLTLILVTLTGCGDDGDNQSQDGVSSATESRYRASEIREYEGARLDPAIGPRDNSIKGVQQVDSFGLTQTAPSSR